MSKTFVKKTISHFAARIMSEAAENKAKELGLSISVCILDESGIQKSFSRMDGAPLISVTASVKKAFTAAGFGLPTGEAWFNFIKDDPILSQGAQHLDNFILLGGGLPIMSEGKVIGAIGVSGGHYKQDEQCALAALQAFDEIE